MPPDNRHILWERGDHPSVELLEQYHGDALPPALHHRLERHLLDCDLCSDALEGMAASDATQTEHHVRDINRRIVAKSSRQRRRTLPLYLTDGRVAAALALVLLSTIVVFYYNYQKVSEQQGMAAQQEKAIQESMDLSEKPTPAIPETVAEAVPDTLRPSTIAANTKPRALRTPRARISPPVREEALIVDDFDNPEVETDIFDLTEAIPEKLTTAQPEILSEVAVPARPLGNTLVPESTSVSKALQGRVAGVNVQRRQAEGSNQLQGRVVDQEGNPLPGVTVVVKGTMTGAATDGQGNFVLTLPDEKATLAFRFIGYETKEQAVDTHTGPITVDLQLDTKALSEVVVTGYASSKTAPVAAIVSARPAEGLKRYRQYLQENVRYTPDMPKGRVVIRATVTPSGTLENLHVTKSLCQACDDEALRLVAQGPNWKPASQAGNNISQEVRIVVRFRPD